MVSCMLPRFFIQGGMGDLLFGKTVDIDIGLARLVHPATLTQQSLSIRLLKVG